MKFLDYLEHQKKNIIIYPPTFDSSGVISAILTSLEERPALLMVENAENVNKALGVALPENFYLKYEYNDVLAEVLVSECYLLIDNLELFLAIVKPEVEIKANLIICITCGVSEDSFHMFEKRWQYSLLKLQLIDFGPLLDYQLELVSSDGKINQLLTIYFLYNDQKHLIYGENKSLEKVEALLKAFSIPYFTLDATTDMNKINAVAQGIILTHSMPNEIKNIGHLHLLDNFDKLFEIYQQIYKRRLYTLPISMLSVHFHIHRENNAETEVYEKLATRIGKETELYSRLLQKAKYLSIIDDEGLIVRE